MDFELSDDQVALQQAVRSLCDGRFDMAAVRQLVDVGGVEADRWRELAETGVFSLTAAEAKGGVGLGWAEAVIVFEQLGRALVPGPLVDTLVAAPLVDGATAGDQVVGMVARTAGTVMVEYLDALDVLLILDADGVHRVAPSELRAVPSRRPLDPLTPVHLVDGLPAGRPVASTDEALALVARATAVTAALELGVAAGATDLAVAYAKERHQFGRPIGSFQAVKHRCADMLVDVEGMRSAVYHAAWALGADDPEGPVAAATAKIWCSDAGVRVAESALQVHGGIGFTWESDVHLHLKRAQLDRTAFGDARHHRTRLAALLRARLEAGESVLG